MKNKWHDFIEEWKDYIPLYIFLAIMFFIVVVSAYYGAL